MAICTQRQKATKSLKMNSIYQKIIGTDAQRLLNVQFQTRFFTLDLFQKFQQSKHINFSFNNHIFCFYILS